MITGFIGIVRFRVGGSLKGVLGILSLIACLIVVIMCFGVGIDRVTEEASGVEFSRIRFFGSMTIDRVPLAITKDGAGHDPTVIHSWLGETLASWICGFVGIFIGLVMTCNYITSASERGSVELTLSRPIPRPIVVLSEYTAGLIVVGVLTAVVMGGSWFALGLRLGVWSPGYLVPILIVVAKFAIVSAVGMLFALLGRHWALAIMIPIGFWFACYSVEQAKDTFLDPIREQVDSIEKERGPGAAAGVPMASLAKGGVGKSVDILYVVLPKPSKFDYLVKWACWGRESIEEDEALKKAFDPANIIISSLAWLVICLGVCCLLFHFREF